MTDIASLISQAVAAKLSPEFIEAEVSKRIDKLVIEAVDDALRSWSPTGKEIHRAVAESLRVKSLDLPSYGDAVCAILKQQIETHVSDLLAGRLAADMEELLKLAPKAIKLSELADEMRKPHEEDGKWGQVITVHVDDRWIYLDEGCALEWANRRQASDHILIGHDGTIFSHWIDGREVKGNTRVGGRYGLTQRLRAMYACGTVITIDEDDVVTSVGDC